MLQGLAPTQVHTHTMGCQLFVPLAPPQARCSPPPCGAVPTLPCGTHSSEGTPAAALQDKDAPRDTGSPRATHSPPEPGCPHMGCAQSPRAARGAVASPACSPLFPWGLIPPEGQGGSASCLPPACGLQPGCEQLAKAAPQLSPALLGN